MPADQFDKDFGYLMPFLEKIAAAAAATSDTAAKAELTNLIADEKQRWARIRQLLSGAPSTSSGAGRSDTVSTATEPPRPRPAFTVGSLRQKRDV
jgi:hypothetical protein